MLIFIDTICIAITINRNPPQSNLGGVSNRYIFHEEENEKIANIVDLK